VGPLDAAMVQRLHRRAKAERWNLPVESFAGFLALSAARAFSEATPEAHRLERYFESLHLEDLALACACADGVESAWDHFVGSYRPVLYRAADALDASGGAREAADSLYAELFGLGARDGERHSHFRYFHGRSSLATWLRAVLAQRYVDRVRHEARFAPLPPDEASQWVSTSPASASASARAVVLIGRLISAAVGTLTPRDRLRLRSYYSHDLTLAQIGKLLGEHEATVSRNLARTRREIRTYVDTELREREAMSDGAITECFEAVLQDPGPLDLAELLAPESDLADKGMHRKKAASDRST
jgi:RNA polymerase sigma factor (sigma-70 family)